MSIVNRSAIVPAADAHKMLHFAYPFTEPSAIPTDSSSEEFRGVQMARLILVNTIVQRYVNIPCPSRKHKRSIVTFRDHSVAAMFCVHCERAWTESSNHPELRDIATDSARYF